MSESVPEDLFINAHTPNYCSMRVRLTKEDFSKIKKLMKHEPVEYGGNFSINFSTGALKIGQLNSGTHSHVKLDRGFIDWHTHPQTCMRIPKSDDQECTIPAPSHHDLVNILKGVINGSVAHFLFTQDGTYVIIPEPKLVQEAKRNFDTCKKRIIETISTLHKQATNEHWKLSRIRKEFKRVVKELQFDFEHFKLSTSPGCVVKYNCEWKDRFVMPRLEIREN